MGGNMTVDGGGGTVVGGGGGAVVGGGGGAVGGGGGGAVGGGGGGGGGDLMVDGQDGGGMMIIVDGGVDGMDGPAPTQCPDVSPLDPLNGSVDCRGDQEGLLCEYGQERCCDQVVASMRVSVWCYATDCLFLCDTRRSHTQCIVSLSLSLSLYSASLNNYSVSATRACLHVFKPMRASIHHVRESVPQQ